jgi:hypothetical protein
MSHKSSMHGGGESSDCIVPAKCANKGGEPSAERMEGRRSAKEIPEHWADTGHRARLRRQLQCVGSACGPRTGRACLSPRWEPCALGARARVCAGGGGQPSSLPRPAALSGGVAVCQRNGWAVERFCWPCGQSLRDRSPMSRFRDAAPGRKLDSCGPKSSNGCGNALLSPSAWLMGW